MEWAWLAVQVKCKTWGRISILLSSYMWGFHKNKTCFPASSKGKKKGHTLSPSQGKCVPTCQRPLLKSLPLLCGIPNRVKETKKRKKQVNILLLLGMFFLLVCTGSIFGIIQQFLAKWKILEQSMFVITF